MPASRQGVRYRREAKARGTELHQAYVVLDTQLLDEVDRWGFERRIRERSEAIRKLLAAGLQTESAC
jgi:metal-responsive CopG/Arc/MetJ family transcriptional regulator